MSGVVDETGEGLRYLGRVIARWWVLIVIGTIFALGLGALAVVAQPEQYRAEAEVLLSPPASETAREAVLNVNDLMSTYAQVVESDAVLAGVRDQLGFPGSLGDLRDSVSVSTVEGSLVLEITVVRSEETEAEAVATSVVEQFGDRLTEVVPIVRAEGAQIVETVTLRAPTATALPRNTFRTLVLALIIGFGFSTVAAFVLDRS